MKRASALVSIVVKQCKHLSDKTSGRRMLKTTILFFLLVLPATLFIFQNAGAKSIDKHKNRLDCYAAIKSHPIDWGIHPADKKYFKSFYTCSKDQKKESPYQLRAKFTNDGGGPYYYLHHKFTNEFECLAWKYRGYGSKWKRECSAKNNLGSLWKHVKSYRESNKGPYWYGFELTKQGQCEHYCKNNSDCIKCSQKPGCGLGYKHMKTFGGTGLNWYACKKR